MPINKYIATIAKKPEMRVELTEAAPDAGEYGVIIFDDDKPVGPHIDPLPLKHARFEAITKTLLYIHHPDPGPWEVTDADVFEEDFVWTPPLPEEELKN